MLITLIPMFRNSFWLPYQKWIVRGVDKVRGRPVRPLRLLGAGVWGDKQFYVKR